MFNAYFAEQYGKARQSEFLKEAEINRLVRQARLGQPRLRDRFLLGVVGVLGSLGLKLKELHKPVDALRSASLVSRGGE